jgi:hypothetical protein
MEVVYTNPNKPERTNFVVSRAETIPQPSNERTYYMVRPTSFNYLTVLDGGKPRFNMSNFLGGIL